MPLKQSVIQKQFIYISEKAAFLIGSGCSLLLTMVSFRGCQGLSIRWVKLWQPISSFSDELNSISTFHFWPSFISVALKQFAMSVILRPASHVRSRSNHLCRASTMRKKHIRLPVRVFCSLLKNHLLNEQFCNRTQKTLFPIVYFSLSVVLAV